MSLCVCMGASLQCPFGTAPATLMANAQMTVQGSQKIVATIMDFKPNVNIPPFAMCNSVANPATVRPPPVLFTPAPCVPAIVAPWAPGSPTVTVGNFPALSQTSKCMCLWGGVISIVDPGQTNTQVP